MTDTDYDLLIGRLALHYKLLTREQISASMGRRIAAGSELPMGEFLVADGLLTEQQLAGLRQAREDYVRRKKAPAPGAAPAASERPSPSPSPSAPPSSASTGPAPARPAPPVPSASPPSSGETLYEGPPIDGDESWHDSDAARVMTAPPRQPPSPAPPAPPAASPAAASAPAPPPVAPPAAAPPPPGPAPGPTAEAPQAAPPFRYEAGMSLDALLTETLRCGASDLHLHSAAPPRVRLAGDLVELTDEPLAPVEARSLIRGALDQGQRARLDEDSQLDFVYELPGRGRFRTSAYRQQRGLDAVFRAIPPEPPDLEELGLPPTLARLTEFPQGLVLLTGPAGCGKSTTLAALVDRISRQRPEHVITLEDPVEHLFESRKALVNQRQVGEHTESFSRALRAALREDPDVIVVGEMRDLETIELALTAAETGHLVLGTLHTGSAIRTLNRILGAFPASQQSQIRVTLSEALRAVVSQRLVRRADGAGRVPAVEVLLNTKAVANLIRENKTFQLRSVMQTGGGQGMCLMDASLAELVRRGVVEREEALRYAEDPKRF